MALPHTADSLPKHKKRGRQVQNKWQKIYHEFVIKCTGHRPSPRMARWP